MLGQVRRRREVIEMVETCANGKMKVRFAAYIEMMKKLKMKEEK